MTEIYWKRSNFVSGRKKTPSQKPKSTCKRFSVS